MKAYEIKKMTEGVDFTDIATIEMEEKYFDTPDSIKAYAQIAYKDDAILVHLSTIEQKIRAVEKGPIGRPWHDSCLEFFFCPMENDSRYFNIEFNSNGCLFFGFGRNAGLSARLLPNKEIDELLSPRILRSEKGWEIFYKIPVDFIRLFFPSFEIRAGKTIRANCYKCADYSEPPHYRSWNPVVADETFTFHRPECFGIMTFI